MTETETPKLKPSKPASIEITTEKEAEEYLGLWDKKFIRIDPVTKQPHESAKEFFWQVIHIFPAYVGSGDEKDFVAQVLAQKYYRNKTYKVLAGAESKKPEITKHVAYHARNSHNDIIDTGCWSNDAKKFMEQFKEDTTI